jgi:adenylate kinase family enzyme
LPIEESAKLTKDQLRRGFAEPQQCPVCSKLAGYVINDVDWHQKRCGLQSRENLMRIHIIGGPGSGKTTLAREVGECLGVEAYELDQIAFTGREFTERPISERIADIYRIAHAHRPAWITEGLFLRWTDELLARANIIVWLDHVSWKRGFKRITRRFVKSAIHEARSRRGLDRFSRFSDYAARPSPSAGRMESRASTAAVLVSYQDKVIQCYNDEAVNAFIDYIRFCQSSRDKERDNGS